MARLGVDYYSIVRTPPGYNEQIPYAELGEVTYRLSEEPVLGHDNSVFTFQSQGNPENRVVVQLSPNSGMYLVSRRADGAFISEGIDHENTVQDRQLVDDPRTPGFLGRPGAMQGAMEVEVPMDEVPDDMPDIGSMTLEEHHGGSRKKRRVYKKRRKHGRSRKSLCLYRKSRRRSKLHSRK
jgi:hypothetical protein